MEGIQWILWKGAGGGRKNYRNKDYAHKDTGAVRVFT